MVERLGGLDSTYHALSHPVRRSMLELLREGPARVTELSRPFDMSLAACSKHLKVLEAASLVSRQIGGREHVLALEPAPLADAAGWIGSYREFWESRLDALAAHFEARPRA